MRGNVLVWVIVVIAAMALSAAGTFFVLGAGQESAPAQEDVSAAPPRAIYHNLRPPFTVDFMVAGRSRYLQAELTFMARKKDVIEAAVLHMPLVRNQIINLMARQDYVALQTQEGKQAFREEVLTTVNELLEAEAGVTGIESVLLTNFVMQ